MTSLRSFLTLPSGLTLDENALTAFSKQSEHRVWLQLEGDRDRVLENPADVEALRAAFLTRAALWTAIEREPYPLYIDPDAILSIEEPASDEALQLQVRGMSDPVFLPSSANAAAFLDEFRRWCRTQGDWQWLDERTGFERSALAAVESHSEPEGAHTIFTFTQGLPLWWRGPLPADFPTDAMRSLTPQLLLNPFFLSAFRRRYAGTSKEGETDWLMYLGHNQQVELTGPSRDTALQALHDMLGDDPLWVHAPSGPVFHLEKLVAYILEQPRAEIFEPRLGIYLREGHELNLYDRADVKEILPLLKTYTDAQNHFLRLPSGICFDKRHIVSWEKRTEGGALAITLANGPGVTVTDPQDLPAAQEALL